MKNPKEILERVSIVDFLAFSIAVANLSVWTAAYLDLFHQNQFNAFFRLFLICSISSFLISYLILKPVDYFFLSKLSFNFTWLLVVVLGSFGFTYLFEQNFSNRGGFPSDFLGFLLLALLPSAIFRYTINFAISYWRERKAMPVSIIE